MPARFQSRNLPQRIRQDPSAKASSHVFPIPSWFVGSSILPKFRAVQSESDDAVSERLGGVCSCGFDDLIIAEVPHDDLARSVFTFREATLEQEVVERVVLDMDCEALYVGIFAWPVRHRARDEGRTSFKSEVVVEIPCPVRLYRESGPRSSAPGCRFREESGELRTNLATGPRPPKQVLPTGFGPVSGAFPGLLSETARGPYP